MQLPLDENDRPLKRGTARRTNRSGESTIEKILGVARTILVRDGIEKFTVERIAREAQVTKGTLLYHFHDKERLLELMMQGYVEHLQKCLEAGIATVRASGRNVPEELETAAGFICWYRDFRRQNVVYSAFGISILSMSAHNDALRRPILQWYRQVFAKLRASGNTEVVAAVLMLEGLFFLRHLQLDMTTDEEIERILHNLQERLGLGAEPFLALAAG